MDSIGILVVIHVLKISNEMWRNKKSEYDVITIVLMAIVLRVRILIVTNLLTIFQKVHAVHQIEELGLVVIVAF